MDFLTIPANALTSFVHRLVYSEAKQNNERFPISINPDTLGKAHARLESWLPYGVLGLLSLRAVIALFTSSIHPHDSSLILSPLVSYCHLSVIVLDVSLFANSPYGSPLESAFWTEAIMPDLLLFCRNLARPKLRDGHERIEWTCVSRLSFFNVSHRVNQGRIVDFRNMATSDILNLQIFAFSRTSYIGRL